MADGGYAETAEPGASSDERDERSPRGRRELVALALRLSLLIVPLIALALLWQAGVLQELIDRRWLVSALQRLSASAWAVPALTALFVVANLLMIPLTVLIIQSAALLGPAWGLAISTVGALCSAAIAFTIGRRLGRRSLDRLLRGRLEQARARLSRGSTLEVAALRLLPLAPYTVFNAAAGATSLGWRPFMFGTLLGLMPGLLALTVLGERLGAALRDPSWATVGWLALAGVGLLVLDVALLRRLRRWRERRR